MELTYTNTICYLGDDGLDGAAIYLAGIMTHYGIDFVHVKSTDSPPEDFENHCYSLYIVSDYPRARFRAGELEHIVRCVREQGSGLLMLGGWESFHGQQGEYGNSPLEEILPIIMRQQDDRRCSAVGILLMPATSHPLVDDLPWTTPPTVVGYNEFTPKQGAIVILHGIRYNVHVLHDDVDNLVMEESDRKFVGEQVTIPLMEGTSLAFRPLELIPMLVVSECGNGRVAAYASDVAPHWVGGFVDWGTSRLSQEVGTASIEVGNSYAEFFRNLVRWTARE